MSLYFFAPEFFQHFTDVLTCEVRLRERKIGIGKDDTLYVFNEQYNGEKRTDYASALIQVPYELRFVPGEGSGTMESKGVYIGDTITYPECTFDKPDGKTFYKWQMTGVDRVADEGDQEKIVENCVTDRVITVIATWRNATNATVQKEPKSNGFTYDGTELALVSEGTAEDGTIKYALGTDKTTVPNKGWSISVPTGTDAGSYYIWYRAIGDNSHSNSTPECCTAEIKKRTVSLSSDTSEKEYDGTPLTKPVVTGWQQSGDEGFVTDEVSDVKAIGTVTTVAQGDVTNTITYMEGEKFKADNYIIIKKEGKLKITKVDPAVTSPTAKSLTYNGSAQELINAGSTNDGTLYYAVTTENTAPAESAYTFDNESIPTATNAGTYYVWYKVKGDANHNDAESTTPIIVTISRPYSGGGTVTIPLTDGGSGKTINITGTVSGSTISLNTITEETFKIR